MEPLPVHMLMTRSSGARPPALRTSAKGKAGPLPASSKPTAEFRHRQHCQPKPFSLLTSNSTRFDAPVNTGATAVGIWFEK